MGNKFIVSITIFILSLVLVQPAIGQEAAGQSAMLDNIIVHADSKFNDNKYNYIVVKQTIKSVLEKKYNSPMADEAEAFTKACQDYNLNCFLLPSIAGLESTFGKFLIPQSYNPFGWGGGLIYFENWSTAIDTVGHALRDNYIEKWNCDSLEKIGTIYSESETWAQRVAYFDGVFEKEYEKNLLYFPTE